MFEGMGFADAVPFRTSGNVVFEAARQADLKARIEAGLHKELGFDVPVFLRTTKEMRALAEHEPFPAELIASSKGKLQVMFLGDKPGAGVRTEVLNLATDEDGLAFGERELYWLPSGGTQRSGLDAKTIDRLIGPATTRTKGTIEQMAAKFFVG